MDSHPRPLIHFGQVDFLVLGRPGSHAISPITREHFPMVHRRDFTEDPLEGSRAISVSDHGDEPFVHPDPYFIDFRLMVQ